MKKCTLRKKKYFFFHFTEIFLAIELPEYFRYFKTARFFFLCEKREINLPLSETSVPFLHVEENFKGVFQV